MCLQLHSPEFLPGDQCLDHAALREHDVQSRSRELLGHNHHAFGELHGIAVSGVPVRVGLSTNWL